MLPLSILLLLFSKISIQYWVILFHIISVLLIPSSVVLYDSSEKNNLKIRRKRYFFNSSKKKKIDCIRSVYDNELFLCIVNLVINALVL